MYDVDVRYLLCVLSILQMYVYSFLNEILYSYMPVHFQMYYAVCIICIFHPLRSCIAMVQTLQPVVNIPKEKNVLAGMFTVLRGMIILN